MARKSAPVTAEQPVLPELLLTHIFDAPRELVFRLWTDPNHVAIWWGPHGFTNPVCEWDARLGGAIHVDMCGPDGTIYPMTGEFLEFVRPERIVFSASALDEQGWPVFEVLNTVTLIEQSGKTELTLRARVVKAQKDAAQYLAGMEEGWMQSLERLAARLAVA